LGVSREQKPASYEHQHSNAEERRIREAALDETIEETFPASDPLSTIPNPDDEEALERAS
jgi:hypothetical protein